MDTEIAVKIGGRWHGAKHSDLLPLTRKEILDRNLHRISEVDFEAICDTARLKVDLQKAQAACETLTEQLMSAEAAKETFEAEAKSCKIEAENARKAKETAMEERGELAKKHEVLSSYFNQREAELQKQLGNIF